MARRWKLLLVLSCSSLGACRHADQAGTNAFGEPQGVSVFSRMSKAQDVSLSPHGKYLAITQWENGNQSLLIVQVSPRKKVCIFEDPETPVGDVYWVNDDRLVFQMLAKDPTRGARPRDMGELYGMDAQDCDGKPIFGYAADRGSGSHSYNLANTTHASGRVVADAPADDSRHVLIEVTPWRALGDVGDPKIQLFKLDAYNGSKSFFASSPLPAAAFEADETGEVRIATGPDPRQEWLSFYRDPGGDWRPLSSVKGMTPDSIPYGISAKAHALYVESPVPGGGGGLYSVSLETGERTLVSHNDLAPPRHPVFDGAAHELVGVEYEYERPTFDVIAPQHPLARLLQAVQTAYPEGYARVISSSVDNTWAVLELFSDRDSGRYVLANTQTGHLDEIARRRPWVRMDEMAPRLALHFKASDGLQVHGFLTLPVPLDGGPAQAVAHAPYPLVVNAHEGPDGIRNFWRFDTESQFLASRGYAVLEVNYRGSGGYGRAYEKAGYHHWGDLIPQDVIDATKAVVARGEVDPSRVCIYGAGFGGYVAMQAAILAPELYKCAAGLNGFYDLVRAEGDADLPFIPRQKNYVKTAWGADDATLKAISPVYNASKLKARVLLIHGEKAVGAVPIQAERFKKALIQSGNPPEWLSEPMENARFYDEGARQRMYSRLAGFLDQNLHAAAASEGPH